MKLNILGGTNPHWKSPLVHLLTQRKVLDQLTGQQRLCLLNIVKVCLTKLKEHKKKVMSFISWRLQMLGW